MKLEHLERKQCVEALTAVGVPGTRDSVLLMGLAVVKMVEAKYTDTVIQQMLNQVMPTKQYEPIVKKLIDNLKVGTNAYGVFGKFETAAFLRHITPGLVAQIDEFVDVLKPYNKPEIWMILHILKLKMLAVNQGITNEKMYDTYKGSFKKENQMREEDFYRAYRRMNSYILPSISTSKEKKVLNRECEDVWKSLSAINETESKQLVRLLDCCKSKLWPELRSSSKIPEDDIKERENFEKLYRKMLQLNPLHYLSFLSLNASESDYPLEMGWVFPAFQGALNPDTATNAVAIIDAPPSFVDAWTRNQRLQKVETIFVFSDQVVAKLMHHVYKSGQHLNRNVEKFEFYNVEQWEKITTSTPPNKVLIFGCAMGAKDLETYQKILNVPTVAIDVFLLQSPIGGGKMEHTKSLMGENAQLVAVDLLPLGIKGSTKPARKMLAQFVFNAKENSDKVKLTDYRLDVASSKMKLVHDLGYDVEVSSLEHTRTLRQIYGTEKAKRITEQKRLKREKGKMPEEIETYRNEGRDNAECYEAFPEFSIWYTTSNDKKSKHGYPRINAYMCSLSNGNKLDSTKKSTTIVPKEEQINWLETSYLPEMQEVVIEEFGSQFKTKEVSIKLFCYLHPDLSKSFSEAEKDSLTKLIHQRIGFCQLNSATEVLENAMEISFPYAPDEELDVHWKTLNTILNFAVKLEVLPANQLEPLMAEYVKRRRNRIQEVRGALVKKSLSDLEMSKVLNGTIEEIENGEMEYLGVLIGLFTGLEPDVICALRWKNFRYIKKYGIYQLSISGRINEDGTEILQLQTDEKYRLVPCIPTLTEYLIKQKKMLRDKFYSGQPFSVLDGIPIFTTAEKVEDAAQRRSFITPKQLKILNKEMIVLAEIAPMKITTRKPDGTIKEMNVRRYSGNLLRENYRFYLRESPLDLDDIEFLLGNKRVTTFGQYYYDFHNDKSQHTLYKRLLWLEKRWNKESRMQPEQVEWDSECIKTEGLGEKGVLRLICSDDCEEIRVTLRSKYGMTAKIIKL